MAQFIKAGILICFFPISRNNQVELLQQNSNYTAVSRNHGSRLLKASFLVKQNAFLSVANKMQLKKF